jgi:hypothetical protein
MPDLYFKNTRTGKRFKIVRMLKETGEIILKGEYAEFREKYDKERFSQMGYVLEKVDAVE